MLEKALKARLILEDGTVHRGRAFGYLKECVGEVVFTTSLIGYQETITDPAYANKIVVWTNPLAGNYGFNLDDAESGSAKIKGLIVRERCEQPNNWRCEMDMTGYFRQNRIIGIEGIDTRALTMHLRRNGIMKGIIDVRGDLSSSQIRQKYETHNERNTVKDTTTKTPYTIDISENGVHIGVLDLGITRSMLTELKNRAGKITVFPAFTDAETITASGVKGVFVSGGGGSPLDISAVTQTVAALTDSLPVFGVSLGGLVTASAIGCTLSSMKFGHHGSSCPVKDLSTGKLYVTHQAHQYTIASVPNNAAETFANINDKSIEGIKHSTKPVFGVTFYPATNACSSNTGFLYDTFIQYAEGGAAGA